MSRNIIIAIVVIIVVVGGGYYLSQSQQKEDSQETTNSTPETQEAAIEIQDFKHSPSVLTVKTGETIKVTNRDVAGHSVTSDDETSFDTGIVGQNQTVEFTAPTEPGSYPYHCTPHPNMTGTLVVEQ
jgi:plastocyanin